MNQQDYLEWVREDLGALAVSKFPNNPEQQILYQLGFLQQLVSRVMWDDSRISHLFNRGVKRAQEREHKLKAPL
jgi:hypothetical protein